MSAAELAFNEATHTYTLHDRPIVSVTTVLKACGLIDFSGVPEPVLERARSRGTRVHKAALYFTEGLLDWTSVADEDRLYVEAAAEFVLASGFEVLGQERRVYHPTHQYAGTVDLFGVWHGFYAVADYKTGRAEDVAAHLQLAAYAEALRHDPPVEWFDFVNTQQIQRLGVELRKDGSYRVEIYQDPRDFSLFLAALAVANYKLRRSL